MMHNKRVNVCGIQIDNLTMQEAIREIERLIQEKKPSYVVTPNVDHVVIYQKDKEFRELYQNADLVLANGVPILWAARFLGTPLKKKVSGSDLLPIVCAYAARKHWRLLFLMEPRRLWKRYFVRDPWFFLLLLGAFLKSLTLSTSVKDESC
jgi:N-acetylglucosaminyldiphosphoundecaprenol N-acetyl-beta-D-mannosaminyltransferase